jgi:hypothetical protein
MHKEFHEQKNIRSESFYLGKYRSFSFEPRFCKIPFRISNGSSSNSPKNLPDIDLTGDQKKNGFERACFEIQIHIVQGRAPSSQSHRDAALSDLNTPRQGMSASVPGPTPFCTPAFPESSKP